MNQKLDEEQLSVIRAQVLESVQNRINEEYNRGIELLKLLVGTSLKILTAVLALSAILLTIFGFKSLGDISEAINAASIREVQNVLHESDLKTVYENEARAAYVNLLIDKELAQRASDSRRSLLSFDQPIDSSSLIEYIGETTIGEREFRRGAYAISYILEAQRFSDALWSPVERILSDESELSTTKKEILLDALSNLKTARESAIIRSLITTGKSDRIRLAAINYVAISDDLQSENLLEEVASDSSPIFEDAALVALARVDPSSLTLQNWVQQFLKENEPANEDLALAGRIVSAIMQRGRTRYYRDARESKQEFDLAFPIYEVILKNIKSIGLGYDDFNGFAGVYISFDESSVSYRVPPSFLDSNLSEEIISKIFDSSKEDTQKFRELIKIFNYGAVNVDNNNGNTEHFGPFLIVREDAQVTVSFQDQQLNIPTGTHRLYVHSGHNHDDDLPILIFRDKFGSIQRFEFSKIESNNPLKIRLERF